MKKLLITTSLAAMLLTGCATGGGGVGDYAMGDDSAALSSARNRREAQVSRAQLDQHRRQRTDVSEEIDLQDKKRRAKKAEIDGSMDTVRQGVGTIGSIAGTAWMIKSLF